MPGAVAEGRGEGNGAKICLSCLFLRGGGDLAEILRKPSPLALSRRERGSW